MQERQEQDRKKCFIITPIGADEADIRRHADGVIDSVLEPVLNEHGFDLYVSHRMSNPGSITNQIMKLILEADLVVANLTSLNPNVMYELAVRHAIRKPVIQICEKGTRLPFDINDERTIFYVNDMKGVVDLKSSFSGMIGDAMNDQTPDNPIYRATQEVSIIKNLQPGELDKDAFNYIISRLDNIEVGIKKHSYIKPELVDTVYLYVEILKKIDEESFLVEMRRIIPSAKILFDRSKLSKEGEFIEVVFHLRHAFNKREMERRIELFKSNDVHVTEYDCLWKDLV